VTAASQVFWLPKAGNSDADHEDAFAVTQNCIAIADGATESSFARAWAQALVEGFTETRAVGDRGPSGGAPEPTAWQTPDAVRSLLPPLQRAWSDGIAWERLPWFAEDKARSGAFSTLLAFRFAPAERADPADSADSAGADRDAAALPKSWSALAVGDSCLFQIRDDALLTAFPLERSEQFNSRPLLLSSNPANNAQVWDSIAYGGGDCLPGDVFLFATDALARWLLAAAELGDRPWQTLLALRSQQDFVELVRGLREQHALRNDDVTLVRVMLPEPSDAAAAPGMHAAGECAHGDEPAVPARDLVPVAVAGESRTGDCSVEESEPATTGAEPDISEGSA
jgi:hypothetical protein